MAGGQRYNLLSSHSLQLASSSQRPEDEKQDDEETTMGLTLKESLLGKNWSQKNGPSLKRHYDIAALSGDDNRIILTLIQQDDAVRQADRTWHAGCRRIRLPGKQHSGWYGDAFREVNDWKFVNRIYRRFRLCGSGNKGDQSPAAHRRRVSDDFAGSEKSNDEVCHRGS